jgi:hypothetical protein
MAKSSELQKDNVVREELATRPHRVLPVLERVVGHPPSVTTARMAEYYRVGETTVANLPRADLFCTVARNRERYRGDLLKNFSNVLYGLG